MESTDPLPRSETTTIRILTLHSRYRAS